MLIIKGNIKCVIGYLSEIPVRNNLQWAFQRKESTRIFQISEGAALGVQSHKVNGHVLKKGKSKWGIGFPMLY